MAPPPLIAVVGPTASGKTALAIRLATEYGGEIICADSRTIYKGMDIGTAKPTDAEQGVVKHWGLDLVEPGERFTAADFKDYANKCIADIRKRGKVPFLVGGTGLYVDAVLYDYRFGDGYDSARRDSLLQMSIESLQNYCKKHNIQLPQNISNKRYIVRAIEQNGINNSSNDVPITNSVVVGISTDAAILRTRIERRSEQLFQDGVVEEAKKLGKKYGWESEAMTGNIYRIIHRYVNGDISLDDAKRLFVIRDRQLAKRQLTWFRRRKHIEWLELDEAYTFLARQLEKYKQP